jgi:SAM-dependent methyltransferase
MRRTEQTIYSVALVLRDAHSNLLCGRRRGLEVHDYENFWSIPSTTIQKDEYDSILAGKGLSDSTTQAFMERIGLEVQFKKVLITGERMRLGYHLFQLVVCAQAKALPKSNSRKYARLEYLSLEQIVQYSEGAVGTCLSLYFQHLIDNGSLSSTFEYREVSPEIADGSFIPEATSSATLWRLAAPNYALLLAGKTGTDGASMRALSLDKHIAKLEKQWAQQGFSVLDVGCGDGALLERLLLNGVDAWGIELNQPGRESVQNHILCGDALKARDLFPEKKFNVVFANLVFEWIEDLAATLAALRQCLSEHGRIIATFTVPEFSHAGKWLNEVDRPNWLQTKSPRRPAELVMINRCVGPVRYYPRGTDQIVMLGGKANLYVCGMKDLYLDSNLSETELTQTLGEKPQLARHILLPMFRIIEFCAGEVNWKPRERP